MRAGFFPRVLGSHPLSAVVGSSKTQFPGVYLPLSGYVKIDRVIHIITELQKVNCNAALSSQSVDSWRARRCLSLSESQNQWPHRTSLPARTMALLGYVN